MRSILITCAIAILSLTVSAQSHINTSNWSLVDTIEFQGYTDLSAVAWDGQHIYLTEWNSDKFIQSDLSGNIQQEFTISGVSQIRDLCFDGQYFYGGRADSVIYIMDLAQQQYLGEIHAPSGVEVRAITYDPIKDAFWTGNWNSDFHLIDKSGNVLDTIPFSKHQQANISGLALDFLNHEGPHLWYSASKPKSPAFLGHLSKTGSYAGMGKELSTELAPQVLNPKARGLGIFSGIGTGAQTYLMGVIEGTPSKVYIYDLPSMLNPYDASVVRVAAPTTACELSSTEMITLEIANTGSDTITNIPLVAKLTYPTYYLHQETITDTILPYSSIQHQLSKAFYMAGQTTYSFEIYTDLAGDLYRGNDTIKQDIINIPPTTPPYTNHMDSTDELRGWRVLDANADGYSWFHTADQGLNGTGAFAYSWNPDGITAADDWLFSPCIEMDSSKHYAMKYKARVGIAGYEEILEVWLGPRPDTAYMAIKIHEPGKLNADSFIYLTDEFKTYDNDVYYLGFHIRSDPDAYTYYLDELNIDESVSINAAEQAKLKIFPVPAVDVVNIRSAKKIQRVRLLNISGQEVLREETQSQSTQLSILELSPGLYFLSVEFDDQQIIRKIIKK